MSSDEHHSLVTALAGNDESSAHSSTSDEQFPRPSYLAIIEFSTRNRGSFFPKYYLSQWWAAYLKLATKPDFFQGKGYSKTHNHKHASDGTWCPIIDICLPDKLSISHSELKEIGTLLAKAGLVQEARPQSGRALRRYEAAIVNGQKKLRYVPKSWASPPPEDMAPSKEELQQLKERLRQADGDGPRIFDTFRTKK